MQRARRAGRRRRRKQIRYIVKVAAWEPELEDG
jgi:hypothetical protein